MTVRLSVDGWPVTAIIPDRTRGAFWRIIDSRAHRTNHDLLTGAEFDVAPVSPETPLPHEYVDELTFTADGHEVVLILSLSRPVLPEPQGHVGLWRRLRGKR